MKRIILTCVLGGALMSASAAWYWPFGDDDAEQLRYSEIVSGVTDAIESAAECLNDGKTYEAVTNYYRALDEIYIVRRDNPDRLESPEFKSLKNREAYIKAAIDSLLLKQAQENARPVAVTDTTDLEKAISAEKSNEKALKGHRDAKTHAKTREDWLAVVDGDIAIGDFAAADLTIEEWLRKNPKDIGFLNLRAASLAAQGDLEQAERTLTDVMNIDPKKHHAYYNLARIRLMKNPPDEDGAARFYTTGRLMGGPRVKEWEGKLKVSDK